MNRAGVAICRVEFFFVNLLLEEENFGAKDCHLEDFVRCEFTPGFLDNLTRHHGASLMGEPSSPPSQGVHMVDKVVKDDALWKAELPPERYAILRQAATEPPWTGELLAEKREGVYSCAGCGNELFASDTKFESGSGWPSFFDSITPGAVELHEDRSLGMVRTEVVCGACGGHLGHLFDDAIGTPTGQRYCMNSLALEFDEKTA